VKREPVGFVGLGDIGAPMALRVVEAGFPLRVYNRTGAKTKPLVDRGALAAPSPAALARDCDIVCLCVTDAAAVEEVVFGPQGIVDGAQAGQLIVDLSTIHPFATQALARRLRERCGIGWVDAPVSGGSAGARAGTLAVFAGGDAADVERARPVLMSFAGRVTHMGATGCGQATKACNQMINIGTIAVVAEALNLASRFGLDAGRLPEALAGGFADSSILRHYAPKMALGTFSGDTSVTMKDLEIILDLGRVTGSALPVVGLLASFYRMLIARGHAQDGMAGVMRMYADGPLTPRTAGRQ